MPETEHPTQLRRSSRLAIVLGLLAAVALAALAIWSFWPKEARAPAPPPAAEAAPAPPEAPAPTVDPEAMRVRVEPASAHPLFRRCLAEGDVVRRFAVLVDNVAEGVSPRKELGCLEPKGPFGTRSRGGRNVISTSSYRRYDAFAAAVGSLDAAALAAVYRELEPGLQGAYRALGYPGASLAQVTGKALRRIESAPVVEGEVAVVPGKGAIWLFADPALEKQRTVEKHLLRMGPRNTRIIQAKARELREALGLPAAPAP
jgi:hypothetical protein